MSAQTFAEGFGDYVYDGLKITAESGPFEVVATLHADDDASAPWDREDGHGPVSDWTTRAKAPGELILSRDGAACRFYDLAEACKIAQRDAWGGPDRIWGETDAHYASRAARHDFDILAAWCKDEWQYYGVAVQVFDRETGIGVTGVYDHALWGIEGNFPGGDHAYLLQVANEYAEEALKDAAGVLAKLAATAAALEPEQ